VTVRKVHDAARTRNHQALASPHVCQWGRHSFAQFFSAMDPVRLQKCLARRW
jgi:hypothetical protein